MYESPTMAGAINAAFTAGAQLVVLANADEFKFMM
jgi:hypothetical protein